MTSGTCNSWANACTLQTALTVAGSGDEIWVKRGVHYPGTTRGASFSLKDGVALYGGFARTETDPSQRNWQANLTVLSGDTDHNDITDANGVVTTTAHITGNNCYHVIWSKNVGSAILDGFVVTAGRADGSAGTQMLGGGMYNTNSRPTLRNITFSGNHAKMSGGMYNANNSRPTLFNGIMWSNSTQPGDTTPNLHNQYSTPHIAYSDIGGCIIFGNWNENCGADGGHNIDANPRFVNLAGGDLRLQPTSPCIDAGSNSAVPGGVTTDLDGNPRFWDRDGDGIATVDMGAYEAWFGYVYLPVVRK